MSNISPLLQEKTHYKDDNGCIIGQEVWDGTNCIPIQKEDPVEIDPIEDISVDTEDIKLEPTECPEGQKWNKELGRCVETIEEEKEEQGLVDPTDLEGVDPVDMLYYNPLFEDVEGSKTINEYTHGHLDGKIRDGILPEISNYIKENFNIDGEGMIIGEDVQNSAMVDYFSGLFNEEDIDQSFLNPVYWYNGVGEIGGFNKVNSITGQKIDGGQKISELWDNVKTEEDFYNLIFDKKWRFGAGKLGNIKDEDGHIIDNSKIIEDHKNNLQNIQDHYSVDKLEANYLYDCVMAGSPEVNRESYSEGRAKIQKGKRESTIVATHPETKQSYRITADNFIKGSGDVPSAADLQEQGYEFDESESQYTYYQGSDMRLQGQLIYGGKADPWCGDPTRCITKYNEEVWNDCSGYAKQRKKDYSIYYSMFNSWKTHGDFSSHDFNSVDDRGYQTGVPYLEDHTDAGTMRVIGKNLLDPNEDQIGKNYNYRSTHEDDNSKDPNMLEFKHFNRKMQGFVMRLVEKYELNPKDGDLAYFVQYMEKHGIEGLENSGLKPRFQYSDGSYGGAEMFSLMPTFCDICGNTRYKGGHEGQDHEFVAGEEKIKKTAGDVIFNKKIFNSLSSEKQQEAINQYKQSLQDHFHQSTQSPQMRAIVEHYACGSGVEDCDKLVDEYLLAYANEYMSLLQEIEDVSTSWSDKDNKEVITETINTFYGIDGLGILETKRLFRDNPELFEGMFKGTQALSDAQAIEFIIKNKKGNKDTRVEECNGCWEIIDGIKSQKECDEAGWKSIGEFESIHNGEKYIGDFKSTGGIWINGECKHRITHKKVPIDYSKEAEEYMNYLKPPHNISDLSILNSKTKNFQSQLKNKLINETQSDIIGKAGYELFSSHIKGLFPEVKMTDELQSVILQSWPKGVGGIDLLEDKYDQGQEDQQRLLDVAKELDEGGGMSTWKINIVDGNLRQVFSQGDYEGSRDCSTHPVYIHGKGWFIGKWARVQGWNSIGGRLINPNFDFDHNILDANGDIVTRPIKVNPAKTIIKQSMQEKKRILSEVLVSVKVRGKEVEENFNGWKNKYEDILTEYANISNIIDPKRLMINPENGNVMYDGKDISLAELVYYQGLMEKQEELAAFIEEEKVFVKWRRYDQELADLLRDQTYLYSGYMEGLNMDQDAVFEELSRNYSEWDRLTLNFQKDMANMMTGLTLGMIGEGFGSIEYQQILKDYYPQAFAASWAGELEGGNALYVKQLMSRNIGTTIAVAAAFIPKYGVTISLVMSTSMAYGAQHNEITLQKIRAKQDLYDLNKAIKEQRMTDDEWIEKYGSLEGKMSDIELAHTLDALQKARDIDSITELDQFLSSLTAAGTAFLTERLTIGLLKGILPKWLGGAAKVTDDMFVGGSKMLYRTGTRITGEMVSENFESIIGNINNAILGTGDWKSLWNGVLIEKGGKWKLDYEAQMELLVLSTILQGPGTLQDVGSVLSSHFSTRAARGEIKTKLQELQTLQEESQSFDKNKIKNGGVSKEAQAKQDKNIKKQVELKQELLIAKDQTLINLTYLNQKELQNLTDKAHRKSQIFKELNELGLSGKTDKKSQEKRKELAAEIEAIQDSMDGIIELAMENSLPEGSKELKELQSRNENDKQNKQEKKNGWRADASYLHGMYTQGKMRAKIFIEQAGGNLIEVKGSDFEADNEGRKIGDEGYVPTNSKLFDFYTKKRGMSAKDANAKIKSHLENASSPGKFGGKEGDADVVLYEDNILNAAYNTGVNDVTLLQAEQAVLSPFHETFHLNHEQTEITYTERADDGTTKLVTVKVTDALNTESGKLEAINAVGQLEGLMKKKLSENKITPDVYNHFVQQMDTYKDSPHQVEEVLNMIGDLMAMGHIDANDAGFKTNFGKSIKQFVNGVSERVTGSNLFAMYNFKDGDGVLNYISQYHKNYQEGKIKYVEQQKDIEDLELKESKVEYDVTLKDLVNKNLALNEEFQKATEGMDRSDPEYIRLRSELDTNQASTAKVRKNINISNQNIATWKTLEREREAFNVILESKETELRIFQDAGNHEEAARVKQEISNLKKTPAHDAAETDLLLQNDPIIGGFALSNYNMYLQSKNVSMEEFKAQISETVTRIIKNFDPNQLVTDINGVTPLDIDGNPNPEYIETKVDFGYYLKSRLDKQYLNIANAAIATKIETTPIDPNIDIVDPTANGTPSLDGMDTRVENTSELVKSLSNVFSTQEQKSSKLKDLSDKKNKLEEKVKNLENKLKSEIPDNVTDADAWILDKKTKLANAEDQLKKVDNQIKNTEKYGVKEEIITKVAEIIDQTETSKNKRKTRKKLKDRFEGEFKDLLKDGLGKPSSPEFKKFINDNADLVVDLVAMKYKGSFPELTRAVIDPLTGKPKRLTVEETNALQMDPDFKGFIESTTAGNILWEINPKYLNENGTINVTQLAYLFYLPGGDKKTNRNGHTRWKALILKLAAEMGHDATMDAIRVNDPGDLEGQLAYYAQIAKRDPNMKFSEIAFPPGYHDKFDLNERALGLNAVIDNLRTTKDLNDIIHIDDPESPDYLTFVGSEFDPETGMYTFRGMEYSKVELAFVYNTIKTIDPSLIDKSTIQFKSHFKNDPNTPTWFNEGMENASVKNKDFANRKVTQVGNFYEKYLGNEIAAKMGYDFGGYINRNLNPAKTTFIKGVYIDPPKGFGDNGKNLSGSIIKSSKNSSKIGKFNPNNINGWDFDKDNGEWVTFTVDGDNNVVEKRSTDPVGEFGAVIQSGEYYQDLVSTKTRTENSASNTKVNLDDVSLYYKGHATFKKINNILKNGNGDGDLSRETKIKLIKEMAPEIEAANIANKQLGVEIMTSMINAVANGEMDFDVFGEILQSQSGIIKGLRAFSSLDFLTILDGEQNFNSYGEHLKPNVQLMIQLQNVMLKNVEFDVNGKAIGLKEGADIEGDLTEVFNGLKQFLTNDAISSMLDKVGGRTWNTELSPLERFKLLSEADRANIFSIYGDDLMTHIISLESNEAIGRKTIEITSENEKTKTKEADQSVTRSNNTENRLSGEKNFNMTTDFDETIIIGGKNIVVAIGPNGETQDIKTEDFLSVYPELEAAGYEFDFKDYNEVKGGEIAPWMDNIESYILENGVEDAGGIIQISNFNVLTARDQKAAFAIKIYIEQELEKRGHKVNIPLESIVGLGVPDADGKYPVVTPEMKRDWVIKNILENGYTDITLADDSGPITDAYNTIKTDFESLGEDFNIEVIDIIELNNLNTKYSQINIEGGKSAVLNEFMQKKFGVNKDAIFSAVQAKARGEKVGTYNNLIPYSAEDFKGLMYQFLGNGKEGMYQYMWLEENLIKPYQRGETKINAEKLRISQQFKELMQTPGIKKKLKTPLFYDAEGKAPSNLTMDHAVRVYIWSEIMGVDMSQHGLSKRDQDLLIKSIKEDPQLVKFANQMSAISNMEAGFTKPNDYWMVDDVRSTMLNLVNSANRVKYLDEFVQNKNEIFSTENLNKIEAQLGPKYREALENILQRMETGTTGYTGQGDRVTNVVNNWVNNSVGAIMFLNMRSGLLQTISTTNYIELSGPNNMGNVASSIANFSQFQADFTDLWNSDYLVGRRKGLKIDLNVAEMNSFIEKAGNKPKAMVSYLLKIGFTPTQIADSFAIAAGGASYVRNYTNAIGDALVDFQKSGADPSVLFEAQTLFTEGDVQYNLKEMGLEGKELSELSEDQILDLANKIAKEKWVMTTESNQQSSQANMLSQQQVGGLGRVILAFKNTPMQYTRTMLRAAQDLKDGRGNPAEHVTKIAYYGVVQSLVFTGLQQAIFAGLGEDDEDWAEREDKVVQGMVDNILNGMGLTGVIIATVKNGVLEFQEQEEKGWNADHTYTILQFANFSPTIGSKLRKIYSSIQTAKFNEEAIDYMSQWDPQNPAWSAVANLISAFTNIPADRMVGKINNLIEASSSENEFWQRLSMLLGWNTWDVDVSTKSDEIQKALKDEKKDVKKVTVKEEAVIEIQDEVEEEIEKQKEQEDKGEDVEAVTCAYVNSKNQRCKVSVDKAGNKCQYHADNPEDIKQCSAIKKDKSRCKENTTNKSGRCHYHPKESK